MPYLINRYTLSILTFCLSSSILAQSFDHGGPQWTTPEHLGQPRFEVQLLERLSENPALCRIDVFIEVINDFLQFVRSDSGLFEATIDLSLSVEVKGDGEVQRQISTLTKKTASYEETNSRRDFLTGLFTIEQPPGEYSLKIILVDKESNRREKAEKEIVLRSKTVDRLAISDLILMKSNEFISGTRLPQQPIAGEALGEQFSTAYLLFDLSRPNISELCEIAMVVSDADEFIVLRDSLSLIGGKSMAAYTIPIPFAGLKFGRYKVVLTSRQGIESVSGVKYFTVNSFGLPKTIRDLDQAIEQLKYVATDGEIRALKDQFASGREQAFIAFWSDKFRVEGEKINGKMIEYYSRINYANENFSGTVRGWETDRGRILVLFGKPSEIERNVFEQDGTPYEIWFYNNLGKRFTFRDEYGFGDYKLVTPAW